MSEIKGMRQERRRFLRNAATVLTGWAAAGLLPFPREARADGGNRVPASGTRIGSVWQGYPLCGSSDQMDAYVPPRRFGGSEKLPSIYWVV